MPIGSIIGAFGANSAKKQAGNVVRAFNDANEQATDLQEDFLDRIFQSTALANEIGQDGIRELAAGVSSGRFSSSGQPGFDTRAFADNFQTDPGFEFARDEGLRAIDRRAAAGGAFNSGARDKARMRFASGLASQQFDNAFNREFGVFADARDFEADARRNDFNMLGQIANLGTGATVTRTNALGDFAKLGTRTAFDTAQGRSGGFKAKGQAAQERAGFLGDAVTNTLHQLPAVPGFINSVGNNFGSLF